MDLSILKKAGARFTLFNDRSISGISHDSNGVHNDHIHVCFGENRSEVQKACKNGLAPTAPLTSPHPMARPAGLMDAYTPTE